MSPRIPALKAREVVRALERDGWRATKQRGSHLKLRKDRRSAKVIVPMHNRDVPPGTLRSILLAAKLSEDEFLGLLRS